VCISLVLLAWNQIHAVVWDQSFGNGGTTVFNLVSGSSAMQRLPDGRFVFGGSTADGQGGNVGFLAAVGANGAIDSSFLNGGWGTIPGVKQVSVLTLDSGGRLLAGIDGGIARLGSGGHLDTTFGTGGIALAFTSTIYEPKAITVRASDGAIIEAGRVAASDFGTAGFSASGQPMWAQQTNASFPTTNRNDSAEAVVVQDDGKILVAGRRHELLNCCLPPGPLQIYGWAMVRYNSDGTRDSSFGTPRRDLTPPPRSFLASVYELSRQPDGKILFVSVDFDLLTIRRLNADGTFDNTFATITDQYHFGNYLDAKIFSNGKIRLAGVGAGVLYDLEIDSATGAVVSSEYPIPRPSGVGENAFELYKAQILEDGDLLVTGLTWDPANTAAKNFLVGRIDWPYSAVPEPSVSMAMLLAAWGLASRRFSAKAHRRGRR